MLARLYGPSREYLMEAAGVEPALPVGMARAFSAGVEPAIVHTRFHLAASFLRWPGIRLVQASRLPSMPLGREIRVSPPFWFTYPKTIPLRAQLPE